MSVIRRVDSLGRVTIPISYRRMLGIESNSNISLTLTTNVITVEKCSSNFDLEAFIKKFLIYTYGNNYQDFLLSKFIMDDINNLLKGYFNNKLLK